MFLEASGLGYILRSGAVAPVEWFRGDICYKCQRAVFCRLIAIWIHLLNSLVVESVSRVRRLTSAPWTWSTMFTDMEVLMRLCA